MAANVLLPPTGTGDSGKSAETIEVSAGIHRQVVASAPYVVTPAGGTVSQVTTGGTAVTAVSGPINGGFICNPANATRQGIGTAEPLYVDMVGTPGSTEAAAVGTTHALDPGDTFVLPPLATGVAVKVNAATNAHKFTIVKW